MEWQIYLENINVNKKFTALMRKELSEMGMMVIRFPEIWPETMYICGGEENFIKIVQKIQREIQ